MQDFCEAASPELAAGVAGGLFACLLALLADEEDVDDSDWASVGVSFAFPLAAGTLALPASTSVFELDEEMSVLLLLVVVVSVFSAPVGPLLSGELVEPVFEAAFLSRLVLVAVVVVDVESFLLSEIVTRVTVSFSFPLPVFSLFFAAGDVAIVTICSDA